MQGGSPRGLAWIPTPQEELPAPKFAYLASSWRSCAPSWLILALLGLILSPSCSKMAPSWPNIAQHRAKMSQHGLQEHPQDPQKPQKPTSVSMFLAIWPFAPKIPKSRQDTSQNGLKLVIFKSKMPILGPSWRQDGQLSAILALTWPILAPRCAPTDLQVEPQTRHKSHLGPSWRQEGHPGAPNHPWSSKFQGFDPIFDPIFKHILLFSTPLTSHVNTRYKRE